MFKIRILRRSDLAACAKVMLRAFQVEPYKEKWTQQSALKRLKFLTQANFKLSLAAFEEDQLLGFLIAQIFPWEDQEGVFVPQIAVDPAHQGQEIGSKLIQELEKRAKKIGLCSIQLSSNRKAKAFSFYEKHGFKATDWTNMVKKI